MHLLQTRYMYLNVAHTGVHHSFRSLQASIEISFLSIYAEDIPALFSVLLTLLSLCKCRRSAWFWCQSAGIDT